MSSSQMGVPDEKGLYRETLMQCRVALGMPLAAPASLALLPHPECALEATASGSCVQGTVWLFGLIPHSDRYVYLISSRTR